LKIKCKINYRGMSEKFGNSILKIRKERER